MKPQYLLCLFRFWYCLCLADECHNMAQSTISPRVFSELLQPTNFEALSVLALLPYRLTRFQDTQMLMTAKKSVKTGLVASAVVSSWCYAATILNSVRLTYVYGFPGLWWFVSGATCQIVCYAIMAIELKRRAPRAVGHSSPSN